MKNYFYLQHSIMAVQDPRMKQLIKNEKLRGIGAYWFIMEKLAMLPNQRAELEDIRIFCNQDIPFAFLKKIICEYQLFVFDEQGFFTPAELNPPCKNEKRTAKKAQESTKSQAKNDEILKKTSKIQANPQNDNFDNSLIDGCLAKNELAIKENIKDITTTTEEKEETAAVAATSESVIAVALMPTVALASTLPVAATSKSADASPEPSASGSRRQPPVPPLTSLTACDDPDRLRRPLHPFRPWQELADGLLTESSAWLDIAYFRSGYGILLRKHLKAAVEIFKTHILAYGKGDDLLEMRDIQRYFINFVNAGSRTSKALYEALSALEAKQRKNMQPDDGAPYRYEQLIDEQRTYLGCPIPKNAPPRPDETAFWDEERQVWISAKKKTKGDC